MKTYDVDLWVQELDKNTNRHMHITKIEVYTTPLAPSDDKPLRYETFVKVHHDPIIYNYTLENLRPAKMLKDDFMKLPYELVKALADDYEEDQGSFCYSDTVTCEVSRYLMDQDEDLYSALPELGWCESGMSSNEHYHLIFGVW